LVCINCSSTHPFKNNAQQGYDGEAGEGRGDGLIKWDGSYINTLFYNGSVCDAGAIIVDAQIRGYQNDTYLTEEPWDVYQITSDWDEFGVSGVCVL